MALAQRYINLTVVEYLEQEAKSELRHEYDNGFIVAMGGASRAHNLIAGTLFATIKTQLKGSACRVYMSNMKLRIQTREHDRFYYPDVMVSCDPTPPSDYYEDKPSLVIEVLSPSTETRDKLEKLAAYSKINSLQEYLTVAQDRAEVIVYRFDGTQTLVTEYQDGDDVELVSVGLRISVREIYSEVTGSLIS